MRGWKITAAIAAVVSVGCGADATKEPAGSSSATTASSTKPAAKPAGSAPASAKPAPAPESGPSGGVAGAGGVEGMKALLAAVKADPPKVTKSLQPTEADLKVLFDDSVVADLKAHVEKMFGGADMEKGLTIDKEPTETNCFSVDDIKGWAKAVSDELPGGYKRVGPKLKPGVTTCEFKIGGIAYDALMFANGKWYFVPKPFRAIKE